MARRRKGPELQVSTSFEAIRIAPQCLATAYEQVVPIPRRPTRSAAGFDASPGLEATDAKAIRKGAERG